MANRQESPPGRQRMLFIISPSLLRTVYSMALRHQYIISTSLAIPTGNGLRPACGQPVGKACVRMAGEGESNACTYLTNQLETSPASALKSLCFQYSIS